MTLAAAPVPAPRSTNVNGSPAANGSSSAISVRGPARRCSRSVSVDFQKLTPISDCQTAAFVSSVSGMQQMLTRVIEVLPYLRRGNAKTLHLGPLLRGPRDRGQPGDAPYPVSYTHLR